MGPSCAQSKRLQPKVTVLRPPDYEVYKSDCEIQIRLSGAGFVQRGAVHGERGRGDQSDRAAHSQEVGQTCKRCT
jgi:hypothetical protein